MRTARPAFALVLLLAIQSLCGLPGGEQPTHAPGVPGELTPQGENVGTIDLVNSQVETGPPDNLQFLEGQQDFYNGNGVRVTAGGKGKLTLVDGSFLTVFNETEIGGVNVSTSPRETDLFLQNQGFLGHVPPGGNTTVDLPNGAKINILGTYFFVVFNSETQVATAGNFDGLVNYIPPGGTEQELPPGRMVNIPADGEVVLMELPFTHEQFEAAVDRAGTPTAGLNALVQEYQIEPQQGTSPETPISRQLKLVSVPFNESNESPAYVITAQIPQLTGSDHPRVQGFNQLLNGIVQKEIDASRQSFLQMDTPPDISGSALHVTHQLIAQIDELWSLKLDFMTYLAGAAHPFTTSRTINYDLTAGRELALAELFLPNSNYLDFISKYCVADLQKQLGEFFIFPEGAEPNPENYRLWNITPDGLQITFQQLQVAPSATGEVLVTVPYSTMQAIIDPQGPLGTVLR